MAKLHHTKYKNNYKNYILECLKTEDVFIDKKPTDEELINYLFDRFISEYGFYLIERQGKQKALSEWLQGLAISIPFYYDEIIELAVEMGSIDENPSEKLAEKVCDNYWSFMANIILSFEPRKHIKYLDYRLSLNDI
jgi:hypothetical protein|tara:strand:- start:1157 stop:1567 length:411 start_codon:yes stop_codon:yes gene_type:complete